MVLKILAILAFFTYFILLVSWAISFFDDKFNNRVPRW